MNPVKPPERLDGKAQKALTQRGLTTLDALRPITRGCRSISATRFLELFVMRYTIAPAVSQGNQTLLDWLNEEIKTLGEENFFHKDYEETLVDTYGLDYEDELVVEGGETASSEAAASEAAASEVASSAAAQ